MISEILILLAVWLAPMVLLLGIAFFKKWRRDRQRRRAPITDKLLRGPGESLRKKLEDLEEDLSSYLAMMFTLPLIKGAARLDERQIQRIAHQLETRCRHVKF